MIPDTEITRVKWSLNCDRLTAYRNIQGRELARQLVERKRRVGGL